MTYHAEWSDQAKRDLEVAKHLLDNAYHEWAAYAAQQAAEKAVKALRMALGTDVKDIKIHDMTRLLGTIPTLAPHSEPLLAWESQSAAHPGTEAGQRYQNHERLGTSVMLFARLRADERAFWFLGPATYVSHEGERPMAITWRLAHPLPGDLFASFAAAVA